MKQIGATIFLFIVAVLVAFSQSGKSPIKEVYISKTPKPTAPANLVVSTIAFNDSRGNNNQLLDANEEAEIKFNLSNNGKGDAYNLMAQVNEVNRINGIQFSKTKVIGNLIANKEISITIPLSGTMQLESGKAEFEILIEEGNDFDADLFKISFNTQKFKNPSITIADHQFTNSEGTKIKLGQSVSLNVVVQNKGQGDASDIKIGFVNPTNVFPANETNFNIDRLRPNESKNILYEFFANKKYSGSDIPIGVTITESYNKYGESKTLSVSLEQSLTKTQQLEVTGVYATPIAIDNISLTSDVDKDIPINLNQSTNRFALVIGNEDYKRFQTGLQSDQNVAFARNDASVFREYLRKTFGFPDKQIFMLTDATRGQMSRELERITELVKLSPGAELIFYYAGHGLPDFETRQGYLIPVDVTASNLKDGISLKDLYSKLASSNASKILVFLDACFSGGGRGENGLLAARTVKVKPKGDIVEGNIVAFTATSGEEVSLPFSSESHGLFTYYLLRKLKDTKGSVTLDELRKYLEAELPKASLIENSMRQTPQVLVAPDLGEKWFKWEF